MHIKIARDACFLLGFLPVKNICLSKCVYRLQVSIYTCYHSVYCTAVSYKMISDTVHVVMPYAYKYQCENKQRKMSLYSHLYKINDIYFFLSLILCNSCFHIIKIYLKYILHIFT